MSTVCSGIGPKRVGPFCGVHFDRSITMDTGDGERRFRIVTYQAYNALGLIGCEHNGVAILDEDNAQVLCDDIAQVSSGWYGVKAKQAKEAERICAMPWKEFRDYVNGNPRARCEI